jgi:hypothetical protein
MSTKQKSKVLLVCCVFVCLAGLVGITPAKGQASVLSRVQTIDDPELGELIRVALQNLPETKRLRQMGRHVEGYQQAKEAEETAKHRTVRLVTEAYVHIKLLDSQIEQSDAKLASSNLPAALTRELVLAKAELVSQRATKLAELREVMHIIPRHPLGRKPVKDLNGWLTFDIVGDSVLVLTGAKPFTNEERPYRYVFVKLMSRKEAMKYALDYVSNSDYHPVRVDVMRNSAGVKFSEELQNELISTVKRANLELEAEVHLSEGVHGSHGRNIYALMGKLGTRYMKRRVPAARPPRTELIREIDRPMDAEEFERYVRRELVEEPEHLPMKFLIRYDEQSKDLALQAEGTIRDIAKKHGVDKLVEVAQEQMDPEEVK